MPPQRIAGARDLADADGLSALVGPVRSFSRTPLTTAGYTGARHERLDVELSTGETRRLVVKHIALATDWTASRTGDRVGREAALLAESSLAEVWAVVDCPYLAYWSNDGDVGLVMEDLSPFLLPDVREPLAEAAEEQLLTTLAALHARFWESPAVDVPWLAKPLHYAGLLDAESAETRGALALLPDAMRKRVQLGWKAAFDRLPRAIAQAMAAPAMETAREWRRLPRTLLHGDAKVANFALTPRGVAAFDWSLVGAGPVAIDLGWYIAVNATRLTRPKEALVARYRQLLIEQLKFNISDEVWNTMIRAAVIAGARMLLWSKAAAMTANAPGARDEWRWWVERLEDAVR